MSLVRPLRRLLRQERASDDACLPAAGNRLSAAEMLTWMRRGFTLVLNHVPPPHFPSPLSSPRIPRHATRASRPFSPRVIGTFARERRHPPRVICPARASIRRGRHLDVDGVCGRMGPVHAGLSLSLSLSLSFSPPPPPALSISLPPSLPLSLPRSLSLSPCPCRPEPALSIGVPIRRRQPPARAPWADAHAGSLALGRGRGGGGAGGHGPEAGGRTGWRPHRLEAATAVSADGGCAAAA